MWFLPSLPLFFLPLSASKDNRWEQLLLPRPGFTSKTLSPLQNVCNNSIPRLVIHVAFPVFICNYSSCCSPAPAFLVGYVLHTMIPSRVPQPGKPTASLPPLLEHSLLSLPLQNREIKNFPWMWHQELQIPTLCGSSGAALCDPDLSWEHLQVKAIPCSWDEPLAGRIEGDTRNPQPDAQKV